MAESDPPGPVYMTLPREILAQTWEPSQIASFPVDAYGPLRLGGVNDAPLTEIADRLLPAIRRGDVHGHELAPRLEHARAGRTRRRGLRGPNGRSAW